MAFYRESCTIVVNIITELKPVFKDRRKYMELKYIKLKPIFKGSRKYKELYPIIPVNIFGKP